MRSLLIIATALFAFGATMTFESSEASAAVCANGVVRAGCVGPRGAVVVRTVDPHAVHACRAGDGDRLMQARGNEVGSIRTTPRPEPGASARLPRDFSVAQISGAD